MGNRKGRKRRQAQYKNLDGGISRRGKSYRRRDSKYSRGACEDRHSVDPRARQSQKKSFVGGLVPVREPRAEPLLTSDQDQKETRAEKQAKAERLLADPAQSLTEKQAKSSNTSQFRQSSQKHHLVETRPWVRVHRGSRQTSRSKGPDRVRCSSKLPDPPVQARLTRASRET